MQHIKELCRYCPPSQEKVQSFKASEDWEMHPSWISGMEALNAYGNWVSSVVLPIAFQWIEEHKPDVYASIPEELKDDVGVVIAAAFKLVKELPAYKEGIQKSTTYEKSVASGTWDPSKTNPTWTKIVKTVRAETEKAFEGQSSVLGVDSK